MKKKFHIPLFLFLAVFILGCQPVLHPNEIIELASSTENSVEVTISMQRDAIGNLTLSGTFTPLEPGLHLYSKDIPKSGVNGLGRPIYLEVAKDSAIEAIGELIESSPPQLPSSGPQELLVYTAGPVTLSMPIFLADTNARTDYVYVTYMACSEQGCRPPVEHKAIEIKIPRQQIADNHE